MIRRLAPPEPLRTASDDDGFPVRIYRRGWHTVTRVVDCWVQRGLWWDEAEAGDVGADRHYVRIVLDDRLVWDIYHGANGAWYLDRIVLN